MIFLEFVEQIFNMTMDNSQSSNHSLLSPPNTSQTSDISSERLRMLPIMIVLGVMFVGICVAMNLFSRARFKNQRSGIFANPRILKVANAQNSQNGGTKRRRSKISSRRSRTELLARAQQMSEQIQKQNQMQFQMEQQQLEEENDELELNIDKLSIITPTEGNQLTTCVQVESLESSNNNKNTSMSDDIIEKNTEN